LPLSRARGPFSHPDWIFEIKWDGFRALLYSDKSGVRLKWQKLAAIPKKEFEEIVSDPAEVPILSGVVGQRGPVGSEQCCGAVTNRLASRRSRSIPR